MLMVVYSSFIECNCHSVFLEYLLKEEEEEIPVVWNTGCGCLEMKEGRAISKGKRMESGA